MADLSLPILDRTASGEEALAAMKEHGRSGVIVQKGKRFWLYGAGHVVLALADNSTATLAEIEPTIELHRHQQRKASGYSTASLRTARFPGDQEGSPKILLSVESDLMDILQASPQDCYCKVDGKPVPGGKTGSDCPDGHRGSVRCV
jgi:hypothetical protein